MGEHQQPLHPGVGSWAPSCSRGAFQYSFRPSCNGSCEANRTPQKDVRKLLSFGWKSSFILTWKLETVYHRVHISNIGTFPTQKNTFFSCRISTGLVAFQSVLGHFWNQPFLKRWIHALLQLGGQRTIIAANEYNPLWWAEHVINLESMQNRNAIYVGGVCQNHTSSDVKHIDIAHEHKAAKCQWSLSS